MEVKVTPSGDFKEPRVRCHKVLVLQLLNILGYVIVILITLLATWGKVFPETLASMNKLIPTRITPAPFTFSVWGLIYLLASFFVIYQALPRQRANRLLFQETHVLFFLSCVMNALWVILCCYRLLWAGAAVILLLEVLLILIYLRINRIKQHHPHHLQPATLTPPIPLSSNPASAPASATPVTPAISTSSFASLPPETPPPAYSNAFDYIVIFTFFSIYLSWVTLLTMLTLTMALRGPANWDGHPWNESGWAILLLGLLVGVTIVMQVQRRDAAFGIVVAWACFGIASAQKADKEVMVASLVYGGVVLLGSLGVLAYKLFRFRKVHAIPLSD